MAREIEGFGPSGRTVYALLENNQGRFWNGSSFEEYDTANRASYVILLTEAGVASGIYQGDFPVAITSSGTYRYYCFIQVGVSPSESDARLNTGRVDWTGSSSVGSATGSMTGEAWRSYILRLGFKRTDKDEELFEATTDAIQEMRRRFMFDEAEADSTTTDTIGQLGYYRLTLENDFGLLLGIVLEDGTTGTPLIQVPKYRFDQLYPSINVEPDRGYPRHFCVYGGQIFIGPKPDSISYNYRMSYSRRAGTVTASTSGVPFTDVYRDVLADKTLERLYRGLGESERANEYRQLFEDGFSYAVRRNRQNSGDHCFNVRIFNI